VIVIIVCGVYIGLDWLRLFVGLDHIVARTFGFAVVVEEAENVSFVQMPQWHTLSPFWVGMPLCAEITDLFTQSVFALMQSQLKPAPLLAFLFTRSITATAITTVPIISKKCSIVVSLVSYDLTILTSRLAVVWHTLHFRYSIKPLPTGSTWSTTKSCMHSPTNSLLPFASTSVGFVIL
jgi:hypothetical protein